MPYCEITPERVEVLDNQRRFLAAWPDPTLFDELVWAGCPLFEDLTGAVLIDIDLDDVTVLLASTDYPLAVHVPLTGPPRELIHSWLRRHEHE